jgi:hypothetical protein
MAIECSSEVRNIIGDLIPKEYSEHTKEVGMTSSNTMTVFLDQTMTDEKIDEEEFPGNENLFRNTDIAPSFTLSVEDDLDDTMSRTSDIMEVEK